MVHRAFGWNPLSRAVIDLVIAVALFAFWRPRDGGAPEWVHGLIAALFAYRGLTSRWEAIAERIGLIRLAGAKQTPSEW